MRRGQGAAVIAGPKRKTTTSQHSSCRRSLLDLRTEVDTIALAAKLSVQSGGSRPGGPEPSGGGVFLEDMIAWGARGGKWAGFTMGLSSGGHSTLATGTQPAVPAFGCACHDRAGSWGM